ncbi:discoidin domain-containing protein [Micromonospora avicenniae]|uniref:F5/8 type C domain-containing protein n=1 Tax=Micromonospora avicenniae TaxID=1198245 RepID=A0A1N6VAY8_9ACTN|nr:discoidin domain-containing protein [Micromonospora avicenniae]SIQ74889.1 F5/8 type C domain-containing protein [Micromonospora avicenniae]
MVQLPGWRPTPPVPGGGQPPGGNLAAGRPTAQSSQTQSYGSANVVDGDPDSYWESANNAFAQWVRVDLGAATTVGRVVLRLPPAATWSARTLSVQGSTDGDSWSDIVASAGRCFDPASGNQVTLSSPATATRYVRVHVTGNTGGPAGQLSQLEVYAA